MRINPTTSDPAVSIREKNNLGRIAQIIGPVLDVAFPPGKMPNIYNALVVKGRDTLGQEINVTCEVQQLLRGFPISTTSIPLFKPSVALIATLLSINPRLLL